MRFSIRGLLFNSTLFLCCAGTAQAQAPSPYVAIPQLDQLMTKNILSLPVINTLQNMPAVALAPGLYGVVPSWNVKAVQAIDVTAQLSKDKQTAVKLLTQLVGHASDFERFTSALDKVEAQKIVIVNGDLQSNSADARILGLARIELQERQILGKAIAGTFGRDALLTYNALTDIFKSHGIQSPVFYDSDDFRADLIFAFAALWTSSGHELRFNLYYDRMSAPVLSRTPISQYEHDFAYVLQSLDLLNPGLKKRFSDILRNARDWDVIVDRMMSPNIKSDELQSIRSEIETIGPLQEDQVAEFLKEIVARHQADSSLCRDFDQNVLPLMARYRIFPATNSADTEETASKNLLGALIGLADLADWYRSKHKLTPNEIALDQYAQHVSNLQLQTFDMDDVSLYWNQSGKENPGDGSMAMPAWMDYARFEENLEASDPVFLVIRLNRAGESNLFANGKPLLFSVPIAYRPLAGQGYKIPTVQMGWARVQDIPLIKSALSVCVTGSSYSSLALCP